jgi:hypothetical protein
MIALLCLAAALYLVAVAVTVHAIITAPLMPPDYGLDADDVQPHASETEAETLEVVTF